ncbi:unnamed protein product, partial [Rhizoctonia solani]
PAEQIAEELGEVKRGKTVPILGGSPSDEPTPPQRPPPRSVFETHIWNPASPPAASSHLPSSVSHSLTLALTRYLQYIRRSHWETDQVGIEEICDFLFQFPVYKLVLGTFEWDDAQSWVEKNLGPVLGSMPTLKTLVLDSYTLSHNILQALSEPRRTHSGNQVGKVLNLKNIEFFRAKVRNGGAGLRSLLESRVHSIQRLVLGGTIEHESLAWSSIQESDEVVDWLKKNIYNICLVRADRGAPDIMRTLLELQLELWDE